MKLLFYKFQKNIVDFFKGHNLLYHLAAIASTYIIVVSGFDWKYFQFFADSRLSFVLFSAALIGGLFPILVPIVILGYGKIRKNIKLLNTGFALGQAVILGYLVSTFYKIFTGRIAPPLNHLDNLIIDITPRPPLSMSLLDTSHIFQFGLFRGGIFWGWPSSHTTIAFAMAFTLWALYSKNKIIKTLALIYVLYIGLGISMTIHWFSDFVAGALVGIVIGIVVGKTFKQRIIDSSPRL
ncbi:phosphatase PAP2 family protein [Patescibacteria group bacterium]|nr:phosphatase PAP2 family protein [Patescibacteria group bacterium]